MRAMTLDQVVRRAIMEMGYTIHLYPYFYNYAVHGLSEMQMDSIGSLKQSKLPTATAATSIDPAYVVGVKYLNGGHLIDIPEGPSLAVEAFRTKDVAATGQDFLFTFSSGQITVRRTDITKSATVDYATAAEYEYNDYNLNEHGEHVGRLFGSVHPVSQEFKYLHDTKELFIANIGGKEAYLLYLDNDTSLSPATVVNPIAVEALTQYIKFRHFDGKRSAQVVEKQLARRDWENAHRVMRARKYQLSVEDILQSFKRNYGLAIK